MHVFPHLSSAANLPNSFRRLTSSEAERKGGARLPLTVAAVVLLSATALQAQQIPVGPFCGDTKTSIAMQNGSLTENGIASSCVSAKTFPGSSGPQVPFVANTFTNGTGADTCVTVSATSSCTDNSRTEFAAYLGSFDPNNISTNYLADPGVSVGGSETANFSFIVPNGQTFVVAAAAAAPGNACGNFCYTLASVPCTITCPDPIVTGTNATNAFGANVPFNVTSACSTTQSCTANNNNPVTSGSFFPVGTTNVTCTGSGSQCSFAVTVNDTTPPAIACPANIALTVAPNTTSQSVQYSAPTVTDNSSNATVVCVPASGSTFPLGITAVTCTAVDPVQNTSQCSFNVALVLPNGSVPALDPRILLALATILAGMGLIFAERRR